MCLHAPLQLKLTSFSSAFQSSDDAFAGLATKQELGMHFIVHIINMNDIQFSSITQQGIVTFAVHFVHNA